MTEDRNNRVEQWREELEEQADKMREVLREQDNDDFDPEDQQVTRPPMDDPQHSQQHIVRGDRDTPAGGSTGRFMGGSAKKRKGGG